MIDAIKQILIKYVSTIATILTIVFLAGFAIKLYRDKKTVEAQYQNLVGTVDKYQQLSAYTAKLQSDYDTQKQLAADAKAQFQDVLAKKDQQISSLSDATFLISGVEDDEKSPDDSEQSTDPTKSYAAYELRFSGPNSPPIGLVKILGTGEAEKISYPFQINLNTLQTVNSDNGHVMVYSKAYLTMLDSGLAAEDKDLKDWKGVAYPLPITGGSSEIDPTRPEGEKHFMLWAPRLVGGINAGVEAGQLMLRPSIGGSFAGYGTSRGDLDFRFAQVSLDSDTKFSSIGINLVPVAYRAFPALFQNTYVGPGIGADNLGVNYFLNLSIGF